MSATAAAATVLPTLLARSPICPPHSPAGLLHTAQAALRLYTSAGFSQLGEPMPPAEEGSGPQLLLCRALSEAAEADSVT